MKYKYKFSFWQQNFIIIVLVVFLISCGSNVNTQEQTDIEQTNIAIRVAELELEQTKEANRTIELVLEQTKEARNNNEVPEMIESTNEPQIDVEATKQAEIINQPTEKPIPIKPTPDPRLFWDDFEEGIRPEWTGNDFSSVNGQLSMNNGFLELSKVGDSSWRNYKIRLSDFVLGKEGDQFHLLVRVQDRDNYISANCNLHRAVYRPCSWSKVVNGQETEIPGSEFRIGYDGIKLWEVEVENSTYRVILNGDIALRFVDNTFDRGGVGVQSKNRLRLGAFEVFALP